MRKLSAVLWVIVALIEIAFVILSLLDSMRTRLLGPDPEGFYTLITTNLALLVLWVGVKGEMLEHRLGEKLDDLEDQFKALRAMRGGVKALVDRDFYNQFGAEIRKARVGVSMTHLDTHPPNRARNTEAGEYYGALHKCIKENKQTKFRRVERASAEKIEWLKELVRTYEGVPNFSLGLLPVRETGRRLGLVSVQLIDDMHAVLVAVAEHDSTQGPRDIWVTDPDSALLWKRYYDDVLWSPAVKVIENGRLNESEWKKITESMEKP